MSEKIKLEYQSDIFFYKCASVGDDWEEKYADNENVLALISKLLSFESDGMSEGNAIDRILYVDGKNPGSLDYIVRVEDGKIVIPSVYCELLDLSEGQEYEIKLGRKAIRLIPVEDDD